MGQVTRNIPEFLDLHDRLHQTTVSNFVQTTSDSRGILVGTRGSLDRRALRRRFEQRFSSVLMANDYVAVYRSLLKRQSISQRQTTVPMPRPVLENKLNGQGLNGGRAYRAAETDTLI